MREGEDTSGLSSDFRVLVDTKLKDDPNWHWTRAETSTETLLRGLGPLPSRVTEVAHHANDEDNQNSKGDTGNWLYSYLCCTDDDRSQLAETPVRYLEQPDRSKFVRRFRNPDCFPDKVVVNCKQQTPEVVVQTSEQKKKRSGLSLRSITGSFSRQRRPEPAEPVEKDLVLLTTPMMTPKGYLKFGAACAMQGWRKTMQDTFLVEQFPSPSSPCEKRNGRMLTLVGVFDGHGGSAVAQFVQKNLMEELRSTRSFQEQKYSQAFTETYLHLDDMLRNPELESELEELDRVQDDCERIIASPKQQLAPGKEDGMVYGGDDHSTTVVLEMKEEFDRDPSLAFPSSDGLHLPAIHQLVGKVDGTTPIAERCGTTALCAIVDGDELIVANVGDTRAVLCRGGHAVRLTEDHKPDNDKETQRIQAAGGRITNGRISGKINVSRALGDLRFKQDTTRLATQQLVSSNPDIVRRRIGPQDEFMIIGTDGLWECLSDQKCVDLLRSELMNSPDGDPTKVLADIIDGCLASERPGLTRRSHKGTDNMTCMVLVFGSPP